MDYADTTVVVVYLTFMVAVGFAARGRQSALADYLGTKGSIPGRFGMIVTGLSIGATFFSGLSLVAYPALFAAYGITPLAVLLGLPLIYAYMTRCFLPAYFKMKPESPYDVIEIGLGKSVRSFASALFVALRLGWMGALIYAPALVIMPMLGLGGELLWPVVFGIGVISTVYTVAGGIRGVIATDALQFVVIVVSLISIIVAAQHALVGSEMEGLQSSWRLTRMFDVNWTIDPRVTVTVLTIGMGGAVANLATFAADQMALQRYLATGSLASAVNTLRTSLLATTVVVLLLAGLGLSVGMWHSINVTGHVPVDADQLVPYYVSTQMPVGFVGLFVAAILAATMSSLTSGINTVTASLVRDFGVLKDTGTGRELLQVKGLSAIVGLVATCITSILSRGGTLYEIMNSVLGLFSGPLLACVWLSMRGKPQIRRTVRPAMLGGMLAGSLCLLTSFSPVWMTAVTFITTVIVAEVGTAWFKPETGDRGVLSSSR